MGGNRLPLSAKNVLHKNQRSSSTDPEQADALWSEKPEIISPVEELAAQTEILRAPGDAEDQLHKVLTFPAHPK